ncbi:MAG: glycoside hydrolase family 3 C-terminal domain-containing protein [Atopobiaceae bacterium]|nr:glycoside hydrolase family 3 C-terminal domain-containing protein [Atopobiaceae bacterium]
MITRRETLQLATLGAASLAAGCAPISNDISTQASEPASATSSTPSSSAPAASHGITIEPLNSAITKTWDAQYYPITYASPEEAKAAAELVAQEIEAEGIVLIKNDVPATPYVDTAPQATQETTVPQAAVAPLAAALPLAENEPIALLGRSAVDTIFGGTGAAAVDMDACHSIADALRAAGFVLNEDILSWIEQELPNHPRAQVGQLDHPDTVTHYIGEIPPASCPFDLAAAVRDSTAIVCLGRPGAEGDDLSLNLLDDLASERKSSFVPNAETERYVEGQHQLELTAEEIELLSLVRAHAAKLIVVLNMATTFELGPLFEQGGPCEADAILTIGLVGGVGTQALAEILSGRIVPSGRTCDTWARDFTATPSFANFGNHTYTDVTNHYTQLGSGAHFVEYAEGIYVGYRWFETAAYEGAINYDESVCVPFGHGLSYTTFEQELISVEVVENEVSAHVAVINTGSFEGKDVVQLYFSAPWEPGHAEKSTVVLVGFAKTSLLAPGEREELLVSWRVDEMANYHAEEQAWVLDKGSYVVSLRANSHLILAEQELTFDETYFETDSATGAPIENRFADCDDYLDRNVLCLSRADFAGTFPLPAQDKTTSEVGISVEQYDAELAQDPTDEMPPTKAKRQLALIDLRGRPMEDPAWDVLLDQLTPEDMRTIVANNIYGTPAAGSVLKPITKDGDGPAGIAYFYEPTGHCAYPCEYVVAQTWNTELARAMGEALGDEALACGMMGWCAPALNTHRSPFGGRNFEYYSEDPLLAGRLGTAAVEGAFSCGVYSQMKHFCLNDQDSNRCWHLLTWAGEQAIREIYARPFELVVKEARGTLPYLNAETGERDELEMSAATAVMSSYNYIGTTWAGGRSSLVTGLLRDEWGFEGYVVSDWSFYDYMEKNQAIMAGTDINFTSEETTGTMVDASSSTAVSAMRRSMHHYLYTLANSNAVNGRPPRALICVEN